MIENNICYLSLFEVKNVSIWDCQSQILTKMKKISGVYKITNTITNITFIVKLFILLIIFCNKQKSQSLDNIIILFSFIVNLFIGIFIFYLTEKTDFIK